MSLLAFVGADNSMVELSARSRSPLWQRRFECAILQPVVGAAAETRPKFLYEVGSWKPMPSGAGCERI